MSKPLSIAEKMMQKMGWEKGQGLGKNEDGRTDIIKVKKKDDSIGIGSKGYDWGNEWWADSYNSALNSGKKKKKKKDDSDDSDSDDSDDSEDSPDEEEEDKEAAGSRGKPDQDGIMSQKSHLFAMGLAAHPEAQNKKGAGFVKGATVVGDEMFEEPGAGLGMEEEKPKKKKFRTEETDKKDLKKANGAIAFKGKEGAWQAGKLARLEKMEQVFREKGRKAAEESMQALTKGTAKPRRSPRLQAGAAPSSSESKKEKKREREGEEDEGEKKKKKKKKNAEEEDEGAEVKKKKKKDKKAKEGEEEGEKKKKTKKKDKES